MSDKSVWYTEVDTALLNLLEKSLILNGNSVYVFVRKAEKEFKVESYPSASIYITNSKYDINRDDPNIKEVFVSKDSSNATYEDKAIPYNLSYQIDLWSKYKSEMNELTKQFIMNIPRWFNLDVLDASGNSRSVLVRQRTSLTTRDYMSGEERIYHSTAIFNIQVELDSGVTHTKPLVKKVNFI